MALLIYNTIDDFLHNKCIFLMLHLPFVQI
ncbi:hypothetical protein [Salmonella enterica subsp. enterica serovar Bredeney]|nr:hypothetical protein [Salmonella enterica subsp. enterica serovar Bredeney]